MSRVPTCWHTPAMTPASPVGQLLLCPIATEAACWPLSNDNPLVSACRGSCRPARWTLSLPKTWKPCSRANPSCNAWRLSGDSLIGMRMAPVTHTRKLCRGVACRRLAPHAGKHRCSQIGQMHIGECSAHSHSQMEPW